jgi:beta-lactamase class A
MLVDRESGETIAYNEDKVYTSASLYKLFVTYAVLNKVDEGKLSLDRPMDAVGGTVDSYITKTITLSANDTARALAELVTWEYVEEFIHENGFTNTTFNLYQSGGVTYTGTLQTNATDVTKIINKLYDNELLSKSSTTYFIDQLNNQQLTYALNRGLTDEVSFAHKTGILDDVSHDAGVITYNDKEYVVTIMSDGWLNATNDASPIFDSLGSSIMNYLYNTK